MALAVGVVGHACAAQELIQAAEHSRDYVSEVLPYPIEEVYGRAASLFDSGRRDYYEDYNPKIYALPENVRSFGELSEEARERFFALPLVRPNKFYVFYGAYPNMQSVLSSLTPLAAMGHSNAGLQRYASLPMSARRYDFYISSPDTPYWYSEYRLGDQPVPFKAFFILHLTPVDANHTAAEMIENQPEVRLGRKVTVDIYGHVHQYDVREVEPTTRDREFLLSCLQQFLERKVPGRHWFSCREKDEVVETPVPFTVP